MKIKPLFSSSSGNCMIIESDNTKIMIDAGVSFKKIKEAYGSDLDLKALFITHSHYDHINAAGVVGRTTGCDIYIPEKCYEEKQKYFPDCKITTIQGGWSQEIGEFFIEAFSTRHDTPDSVGYIITEISTKKKFGFITDTGIITILMRKALQNCDAYFIESDYDEEGLEKCSEYDDYLKDRIRSPLGHLSNQETIKFINEHVDKEKVKFIFLGHLSKNTNSPEILKGRLNESFDSDFIKKIYIIKEPLELEL